MFPVHQSQSPVSREEIQELHYITPLENLDSILSKGLLSHNKAESFKKRDISLKSCQQIRATKTVPARLIGQTAKIHDCVNLYFNAKNCMLYLRRHESETLCILRIFPNVLDLPNAVVVDRNATTNKAQFFSAAEGVSKLARQVLFGPSWSSSSDTQEVKEEKKALRCAEVLVFGSLHPSYIGGIYVVSQKVKSLIEATSPVEVTVNPEFFFQSYYRSPCPPLSNRIFTHLVQRSANPHSPKRKAIPQIQEQLSIENFSGKRKSEEAALVEPEPKVQSSSSSSSRSNLLYLKGDLLKSSADTLVNTVNCHGVMGKGIALQFKELYPEMFLDYKEKCNQKEVLPGVPYCYRVSPDRLVVNFPTKNYWGHGSQIGWIKNGLEEIARNYRAWNIQTLALPPLGCGNGGLSWSEVKPLIEETLGGLDGLTVHVYEPNS